MSVRIVSQKAVVLAAQVWCTPTCEKKEFDVILATEFAKLLDTEMWQPHLGCATTRQLFEELMARSALDYRTMGPEALPGEKK